MFQSIGIIKHMFHWSNEIAAQSGHSPFIGKITILNANGSTWWIESLFNIYRLQRLQTLQIKFRSATQRLYNTNALEMLTAEAKYMQSTVGIKKK